MNKIFIILVCLAPTGLGERKQATEEGMRSLEAQTSANADATAQSFAEMDQSKSSKQVAPLTVLAKLLLASNPASALGFSPRGAGAHFPRSVGKLDPPRQAALVHGGAVMLLNDLGRTRAGLRRFDTKMMSESEEFYSDHEWHRGHVALAQQLLDQLLQPRPLPVIVSPSVAKADMLNLGTDLQAAVDGGAEWLHFSVQDGNFVPKMGIGSPVVAAAREAFPSTVIDVKLGCMDPENRVSEFAKAGADVISFHPEATKQPGAVVQAISKAGCAPGLVLNPGTSVSSIEPLLGHVAVIVIMLVSPGYGGPKFIDGALRKIEEIYSLCDSRGLRVPYIEVDGGVSTKNAAKLIKAGANVLVAGGSVFSADDKKAAIDALRADPSVQGVRGSWGVAPF